MANRSERLAQDAAMPWERYELSGPDDSRAVVVPSLGCNCIDWECHGRARLFTPPLAELAQRPTRGGVPILFPFPNRIRGGRFAWSGREFQLPCNDSTQSNAIHGFTTRASWRVLECAADGGGAWLTAEFLASRDVPESHDLWPADQRLTVTVRLADRSLRFEATVFNPGSSPLPFGLGYHPYFAVEPGDRVQSAARSRWELADSLPTGRILPLESAFDLRQPRAVESLTLDDVYTEFPPESPDADGLVERGRLFASDGEAIAVRASPDFRELVVFTPVHRRAICLEPYTCPTDAVNLAARGLDVGWRVVAPGASWRGTVEFRVV